MTRRGQQYEYLVGRDCMVEMARLTLQERGIEFGEFWHISRSSGSFTVAWFWRKDMESSNCNLSVQIDEEACKVLWAF